MKKILLTIILLTLNLLANNVATITALKGKADIQREKNLIIASLGAELEQKDSIITKENAKLQIIFKDETVISIGKNSEFSIQEYIFEDKNQPIAKFNMLRGAMRTITGQIGDIAPQKFSVSTTTATIGIRGTNFSVFVEDSGSTSVFCTYGAIGVSIAGVTHVVQQGFYISVTPQGKVEVKEFTATELKAKKDEYFETPKDKDADITKDTTTVQTEEETTENNTQLNVAVTDDSALILTEIDNTTGDVTQNSGDITTYIMNDASYTGTYSVTSVVGAGTNIGQTGDSGTAKLNIDFGKDLAKLQLTASDSTVATFDSNPVFTSTGFKVDQNPQVAANPGNATGTFSDSIGNTVNGTFKHTAASTDSSSGTYNVTSSQTLY